MKTERRHELQTNTLAATLARWIEVAKPYSRAAMAALVAIVVALFAWGFLSSQNSRRVAEGWTEFYDASMQPNRVERLADISQQYAGTQVSDWARLTLADLQLTNGTNRLMAQKQEARDELRQAAEGFQAVLLADSSPMICQRAMFGLARAHEAEAAFEKSNDKLTRAREEYLSIAARWPNSAFVAAANARAKDLDQQDTKSFYDWLARYEPPRSLAREPGTPGARPDFLDLPTGTEVTPPGLEGEKNPRLRIFSHAADGKTDKTDAEKPAEPGEKTDAAPDGKPDESPEKPAEPAADKPAEAANEKTPEPAPESK